MKKDQKSVLALLAIFVVLLSTTLFVSFSSNLDVQEVVVKSITPIYDSNSTVVVDDNNVVFNDKNQVVEYKVVIENTQNYDVKITDIKLSTPTEEFLTYEVKDIEENDVLTANSTKELTVSFETTGIKGWGRNFADELTANISFEKVVKEVVPPVEDKEEDKIPEKPVDNTEELINKSEKIEIIRVTKDTIEFKETPKLVKGDKISVWLYSDPVFLGYFEVVEKDGIKQIVGLEEALKQANVKEGEHHIVLATEENETIGYVEVYVNENNTLSQKNPADDGKIENPYTSDKGLIIVLGVATCLTGIAVIVVSKNKFAKYTVFILMLSPVLSTTSAEDPIELSINNNVNFKSQNVMKPAGVVSCYNCYSLEASDYWVYRKQIEKIYIQNEISEIEEYAYKFDVSQQQNGRVIAYLVPTGEQKEVDIIEMEWALADMYDLYLQADGIIYSNPNASYYFENMYYLNLIDNIKGFDTSNATDMSLMFAQTASHSESLELDLRNFDTSNVRNMEYMFSYSNVKMDLSNFDTSNVTNMHGMFYDADADCLNISSFDTRNVTDMSYMFGNTGSNSVEFTLNLGEKFDTSNVTDMSNMFKRTGYNSTKINTSITISNPNTTSYTDMFNNVATKTGSQIIVNFTRETEILVAQMIATKSSSSNVVIGSCIDCGEGYIPIGTEIDINGEKFNVISQTDDTVTMFAQYNLGTDYKQSTTANLVSFSDAAGWEYTPGPKEIDIQKWSTNPKTYVNEYVEYLKTELGDNSVTGDLITLKELKALGCTISEDYKWTSNTSDRTCANSSHNSWIVDGKVWWTRSASSNNSRYIWYVNTGGTLSDDSYSDYGRSIRPTITISKDTLKNLN